MAHRDPFAKCETCRRRTAGVSILTVFRSRCNRSDLFRALSEELRRRRRSADSHFWLRTCENAAAWWCREVAAASPRRFVAGISVAERRELRRNPMAPDKTATAVVPDLVFWRLCVRRICEAAPVPVLRESYCRCCKRPSGILPSPDTAFRSCV